jgi:hypothetical protein
MEEATGTTQSIDFSVSLIVLTLDAEGNGEGTLTDGAEILFNETTNSLEITNIGNQPIRLTNVTTVN